MTAAHLAMVRSLASAQLERAQALRDPDTCLACAGTGELVFTEVGPWGDIRIKSECPDCAEGEGADRGE